MKRNESIKNMARTVIIYGDRNMSCTRCGFYRGLIADDLHSLGLPRGTACKTPSSVEGCTVVVWIYVQVSYFITIPARNTVNSLPLSNRAKHQCLSPAIHSISAYFPVLLLFFIIIRSSRTHFSSNSGIAENGIEGSWKFTSESTPNDIVAAILN